MVNVEIESINEIAIAAGEAIMRLYDGDRSAVAKEDGSPLTAADQASHRIIVDALARLTPDTPIVSEEGKGIPYSTRRSWGQFWLVDPLDGTKEFIKHNGEFTANIALVEGHRPVLGVIYAPALKTLYFAHTSAGAFRRSGAPGTHAEPIRVRACPSDGITVARSRSHSSAEEEQFLANFVVRDSVSIGSSLKFCLVAEGKADLYYRHGPTWEWDTAAGHAIAEIAGARVRGLQYGKEDLLNGSFVCAAFDVDENQHN